VQTDEEVEEKRIKSIFGAFLLLAKKGYIDNERFSLNLSLLKLTVKHYSRNLKALKIRYGIQNNAQPQKAAGLITAAILRFKPVLPKNVSDGNLFHSDENEVLAVFHGLCVCAEQIDGKIDLQQVVSIWLKPEFVEWLRNCLYLFRFGEYTAESLTFSFDALARFVK